MSRNRLRTTTPAVLTLLVLVGLLTGLAPAHAGNTRAVRILVNGDSITQGFHGDYTWRYRLWQEFRRQGVPVEFVGSRTSPVVQSGFGSSAYADPGFDTSHYAQVGTLLAQQPGRIGREIRSQDPDIIVLEAGVNDIRHGASAAQTNGYLRSWIAAARAAKADARLVVSPVLAAVSPSRPWLGQRIAEFNRLARTSVAELTTAESPITMADTARGWSVQAHTYDDIHPNPTGETLIAQRLAETFHRLGVLPRAASLYRATPWNRSPRVRVVVRGRRAVLSWDNQGTSGARIWMRRAGRAATFSPIRRGATMTIALHPRSVHQFRVQLIRGRMSTPFGPTTRVSVAGAARPAAVAKVTVDRTAVRWTASPAATRYVVKFRKAHTRRWVTRRTSGLTLSARNVVLARVKAVNAAGESPFRAGAR